MRKREKRESERDKPTNIKTYNEGETKRTKQIDIPTERKKNSERIRSGKNKFKKCKNNKIH